MLNTSKKNYGCGTQVLKLLPPRNCDFLIRPSILQQNTYYGCQSSKARPNVLFSITENTDSSASAKISRALLPTTSKAQKRSQLPITTTRFLS